MHGCRKALIEHDTAQSRTCFRLQRCVRCPARTVVVLNNGEPQTCQQRQPADMLSEVEQVRHANANVHTTCSSECNMSIRSSRQQIAKQIQDTCIWGEMMRKMFYRHHVYHKRIRGLLPM